VDNVDPFGVRRKGESIMSRSGRVTRIFVGLVLLVGLNAWSDSNVITTEYVEEFLHNFERLAAKKDFSLIKGMMHTGVFIRFNDGDFEGIDAAKGVFERTWASSATVKDEKFYLTDIKVLSTDTNSAAATYTYNWEGTYQSKPFKIVGRGTRVLTTQDGTLRIVHEHLSPFPK
jgi:ketosteroid isomerase-like protein